MSSPTVDDTRLEDEEPRARGTLARLWPALEVHQYRDYWLYNLTSLSAQQISMIAQAWLIYDLTRSPLYLALAGLSSAIPGIAFSLFGGVMADRLDIRPLLSLTQLFLTVVCFVMAALTGTGVIEPWMVLAGAFLNGVLQALSGPARQSIYPQLVPRELIGSAVSLNSTAWQGTRIIAPALGGVLISVAGISVVFVICAVAYLPFAVFVRTLTFQRQQARGTTIMSALVEGPRYVLANPLFMALIGLTFFNTFFGVGLTHIFPMIAREVLNVGPSGLGIMYSAMGTGALFGLTCTGTFGRVSRPGLLILTFATIYGFIVASLAFATSFWAALVVLFLMNACSQVYLITIQTVLQMKVPDQLRGRVMGIYAMTYNLGPLGAAQAGSLAALFNPSAAIVIAGACMVALSLYLAATNTLLRGLRAETAAAS